MYLPEKDLDETKLFHPAWNIRSSYATRLFDVLDHLYILVTDSSEAVRANAYGNPRAPLSMVSQGMDDPSPLVRRHLMVYLPQTFRPRLYHNPQEPLTANILYQIIEKLERMQQEWPMLDEIPIRIQFCQRWLKQFDQ